MKDLRTIRSHEYKNDYLYIVIRQAPEQGPQTHLYCSGINISRFDPLCWGKAGICSNPAFKGLQLLRADVSALAIKLGITTRSADHVDCALMTPPAKEGWYRENLLIHGASPKAAERILVYSVMDLVKTVLAVCAPDARLPRALPSPHALQKYLASLGVKNYRTAGPQIIARKRDMDKS